MSGNVVSCCHMLSPPQADHCKPERRWSSHVTVPVQTPSPRHSSGQSDKVAQCSYLTSTSHRRIFASICEFLTSSNHMQTNESPLPGIRLVCSEASLGDGDVDTEWMLIARLMLCHEVISSNSLQRCFVIVHDAARG
jgi:hypothetical protein